MKIVFVCVGNTCRSPILMFMFAKFASEHCFDCEVDSAGIAAGSAGLNPDAAAVLKENGIIFDENFMSKTIDRPLFDSADAVIALTNPIFRELRRRFGESVKIHDFEAVTGKAVPDPFGGGFAEYKSTYELLAAVMPDLLAYLLKID